VRVLHVIGSYPIPPYGGVETTAYYLGRELSRLNVEIKVVAPTASSKRHVEGGCEFLGLPAGRVSNWIQIPRPSSVSSLRRLIRWADVIHVLNPQELFNLIAIGLTFEARRPLVLSVPVSNSMSSHPKALFRLAGVLDDRLIQSLFRRVSVVHLKNLSDYEYAKRITPHAIYIPDAAASFLFSAPASGADLRKELRLEAAYPILLFLGRLHPLKGPTHLVEAVRILLGTQPSTAAIIAGPDFEGQSSKIGRLSERLGVRNRIRILGAIDEEKKVDVLDLADVVVVPSLSDFVEGFSIVASEAWTRHKPVVGYPVGALKVRVRDGENGYLAGRIEPKALASAISRALKLGPVPVPSDVMSWTQVAEQFDQLYRSICGRPS
jgi:glycosyltransferase involved in cell wall biosynthesis